MDKEIRNSVEEPSTNFLGRINKEFHANYRANKQNCYNDIKNGKILLFVRMDSRLFSICGEQIEEHIINGSKYHSLKALVHSTLAAYYLLTDAPTKSLPILNDWILALSEFSEIPASTQIAGLLNDLKGSVESSGVLSCQQLDTFCEKLSPIYASLMMDAATNEITNIVEILDQDFKKFNKSSAETFLVVFGGHQPRYRELAKLVFKKWFNELDDHVVDCEHHIRYLEGGTSVDDAISLIATIMTDRQLAQKFLGGVKGLDQDALGVVAQKAIEEFWQDRGISCNTKPL